MNVYNKITYNKNCKEYNDRIPGIYLFGRIININGSDTPNEYEEISKINSNKYPLPELKLKIKNTYINRPSVENSYSWWENDEGTEYDHSYRYYNNLYPLEIIIIISNKDVIYRKQITVENWNDGMILDSIEELKPII